VGVPTQGLHQAAWFLSAQEPPKSNFLNRLWQKKNSLTRLKELSVPQAAYFTIWHPSDSSVRSGMFIVLARSGKIQAP